MERILMPGSFQSRHRECEPNFRKGSKATLDIKLDRLSARGLAQPVQSLLEDRSDPIPQIAEGGFS